MLPKTWVSWHLGFSSAGSATFLRHQPWISAVVAGGGVEGYRPGNAVAEIFAGRGGPTGVGQGRGWTPLTMVKGGLKGGLVWFKHVQFKHRLNKQTV